MNNNNLFVQDQGGTYRVASTQEIFTTARARIDEEHQRGTELTSVKATENYLFPKLAELEHEVFSAIYLDSKNRIIEYVQHFNGSVASCNVYPRTVLKHALTLNAAAVIFAHNHPSGSSEPSQADKNLTQQLRKLLHEIDVTVLDHMIIARSESTSFAEIGLL